MFRGLKSEVIINDLISNNSHPLHVLRLRLQSDFSSCVAALNSHRSSKTGIESRVEIDYACKGMRGKMKR